MLDFKQKDVMAQIANKNILVQYFRLVLGDPNTLYAQFNKLERIYIKIPILDHSD